MPALLYVRGAVACPIPGHGGLQPGTSTRVTLCCTIVWSGWAPRASGLVLCARVWTGPDETLALGLHAHMRVFELGGWELVLRDLRFCCTLGGSCGMHRVMIEEGESVGFEGLPPLKMAGTWLE